MPNIKRANASGITKPGTAIADVPDAPTIGTATGGQAAATVTFTPATTGGTATTFTATSTPGSITGTAASSPITISGLTNGTAYTFTVTATNSTGTSAASSASNQVTPVSLGDMDPIAMVEVGSAGSSTITFSSIPQTYTHLQLRVLGLTNSGSQFEPMQIRFNSDTGNNYRLNHTLMGDGSAVSASTDGQGTRLLFYKFGADGYLAGAFGAGIIDILDYKNTNKYKTVRALIGTDLNGAGAITLNSGLWMDTSAISNIEIKTNGGNNWKQYSSFALYGIK